MTTLGWIALGVVSGFALIFLLLLIRLFIVDKEALATTDKWLHDARAQRDRLNTKNAEFVAQVKDRDEAIERYVKNEADLLIANEKLRGQLMEKHAQLVALQTTNEAYTEAIAEQHEQLAEHKRTITQQQQIIDDLRKPPPLAPLVAKPAPRKKG